jgi:hypothetical protein
MNLFCEENIDVFDGENPAQTMKLLKNLFIYFNLFY